jgi:SAM-dependent methyltransferase
MSSSTDTTVVKEAAKAQRSAISDTDLRKSPFRPSDIWKAPLHDFPIRDEILCQFLPLSPEMDILEIGPGSGFTAYWLSRVVRKMTVVDVTPEVVADLRDQLGAISNLNCVCADVTRPELARRLKQRFDVAFGLDVFEYLVDPAASLRNLAELLRPGGELFLTFPNVPPPEGDGVTYFSHPEEVETLLGQAGFGQWQVFGVRKREFAEAAFQLLHERPLALLRGMRRAGHSARPQTYEKTWAFQRRLQLNRFRFLLQLYWTLLGSLIRLGGQVFATERATEEILGRQLVVRAWR